MSKDDLTEKQKTFCHEYMVDKNGAQAAIRAGYAPKFADRQAYELLENPRVKSYLAALIEKQNKRLAISSDRVVQEIERMAMFDPIHLTDIESPADIKKLPEDVRRAIVGWGYVQDRFVVKFAKEKALEMLGRHHKLFTDMKETKVTHSLEDLLSQSNEEEGSDESEN